MKIAGRSKDKSLVEAIELKGHKWFVGCQFHPEFTSDPRSGHPLFNGFVRAAKLKKMTTIIIDDVKIGNDEKIVFFAGLNILESSKQTIEVALKLKQISENIGNHLVFKASFDKANSLPLILIEGLESKKE